MDFERKGANCLAISIKKEQFVFDPAIAQYGLKNQGSKAIVKIATEPAGVQGVAAGEAVVIDMPGEYEVHNVSLVGVAARMHTEEEGQRGGTMYRLETEDMAVAVLGNVHPDVTDEQLEKLGVVDVVVVPVGGNGLTLDATGAAALVRRIEPKIVIPVHYQEDGVTYPVDQAPLSRFVGELGVTAEQMAKLKLKPADLQDGLRVVEITRTS